MRYKEFLEITGESQRTIVHWCDRRILIPVIDAKGAGSKREFDGECVRQAKLIRKLINVGFGIWGIKKILDMARGQIESPINIKLSDSIDLKIDV